MYATVVSAIVVVIEPSCSRANPVPIFIFKETGLKPSPLGELPY
jgi:hypothetical protein